MAPVARVYSLTPMTRSVNLQRRVVIQGFDLPLRGLTIAGLALIPAVPLTAIVWPFFGTDALLTIVVVEVFAFWAIETRTRSGLKLRRYQRFIDMRKSISGSFTICGTAIEPGRHVFGHVLDSSRPGQPLSRPDLVPDDRIADFTIRRMVGGEAKQKEGSSR